MKPYLSIIIPAFNEEKRILKTLKSIAEYLEKQHYPAEVLIVSDGSTDRTAKIVAEFCAKNTNFHLIDNKTNQGKGAVVKQGMLKTQGQYLLFSDADGSTPINQVEKLLPLTQQGYQVVIGSRYLEPGSIKIPQPWTRTLLARASNWLIQIFLLRGIKDTQCGFELFEQAAAQQIFPKQTLERWGFDFEILTIAKILGFRIREVAVDWYNKPESKVKGIAAVKTLIDLAKVKWNKMIGKYRE